MTTDFRALCAELVNRFDELYGRICDDDTIIYVDSEVNELMNYARAALAEAVPEGREPASVIEQPTVMQLIELSDEIEAAGLGQVDFARAVLARWGTPSLAETRSSLGDAPQPVPVSERLPGDQLCWWYEPDEDDDGIGYGGKWTLLRIRGCVSCYTHWLPAHALPLPTVND